MSLNLINHYLQTHTYLAFLYHFIKTSSNIALGKDSHSGWSRVPVFALRGDISVCSNPSFKMSLHLLSTSLCSAKIRKNIKWLLELLRPYSWHLIWNLILHKIAPKRHSRGVQILVRLDCFSHSITMVVWKPARWKQPNFTETSPTEGCFAEIVWRVRNLSV